jgi:hypothetical protein
MLQLRPRTGLYFNLRDIVLRADPQTAALLIRKVMFKHYLNPSVHSSSIAELYLLFDTNSILDTSLLSSIFKPSE